MHYGFEYMRNQLLVILLGVIASCGGSKPPATPQDPTATTGSAGSASEAGPADKQVDGPTCSCEEPIDPACVDMCAGHKRLDEQLPPAGSP